MIVRKFHTQILNYCDCPIAISDGFTECTNSIKCENNLKGLVFSFQILRARTLYRKTHLLNAMNKGLTIGPAIPKQGSVFFFEGEDTDMDDEEER